MQDITITLTDKEYAEYTVADRTVNKKAVSIESIVERVRKHSKTIETELRIALSIMTQQQRLHYQCCVCKEERRTNPFDNAPRFLNGERIYCSIGNCIHSHQFHPDKCFNCREHNRDAGVSHYEKA